MEVRRATDNDVLFMRELGVAMHAECRYSNLNLDLDKWEALLRDLISDQRGIVLVSDHGMLVGLVDEYFFGHDKHAMEYVWYVDPAHRNSGEGSALLVEYAAIARAMGVKDIHVENSTGVNVDATEQLFVRLGFKRLGGNYVMEV